MSFNKFITDMLNIQSDDIDSLQHYKRPNGDTIIKLKLKNHSPLCPYCRGKTKIHGYYPRKLTHSTLVDRKCSIIYLQRRYYCLACESTFHEANPFINTKESITFETKINVLNELKLTNATYSSTARRFNLSATKVQRIFDAHVNIPRKTLPMVLSIDEHYFPQSNYSSLYCCLLMDFLTGELIDVLPDRRKPYLTHYLSMIKNTTYNYNTLTSELDNVKYISIDLYDNFKDLAKLYFPKAVICADSFHVLKHLTEGFRKVRLRCKRKTEDKTYIYLLTKFKFVFNHDVELNNAPKYNKRLQRRVNYRNIRDILFECFPELQKAYELKEYYINFNATCKKEDAKMNLAIAVGMFFESDIPEYDEFCSMLINWSEEIENSFNVVSKKRINNSYIESKNRQLKHLINNANGFGNFKRTRNRILYCLNKKDTFKI